MNEGRVGCLRSVESRDATDGLAAADDCLADADDLRAAGCAAAVCIGGDAPPPGTMTVIREPGVAPGGTATRTICPPTFAWICWPGTAPAGTII